ncbi:alpha/beta hydrolase [Mycobacterium fragae]|uniref:Alpha/beta hydrolase n=1 Tax=Mycobacterium fragae TaxID=1260918 RepID=A0A1X1UYS8_9MYCO|nr:alpha/beta hydrolase [Mycobacterium fragae]MCV7401696.1 alpha/beta hydrolase [Mycobacterium fragae]ORV61982.1 alpha/beta hydrolase [Mycobacterium fragae]
MSTYVLIPGAWHGAWSWRPVAERLRAAGHRAITLTLPGMNDGDDPSGYQLQDAIDYIAHEVRRLESGKVTLVAHSWGGFPATGAAQSLAGRVEKLVYYNGHVPLPGRSLMDENPRDKRVSGLRRIKESPVGATPATLEYLKQELMQGVSPDLQRLVADLLTLQPGGYFLGALDFHPLDLGIPMVYITADDDLAMPRPAAESAARIGVQPIVVPGTHNSMLTHPDEVAKAILAA